MDNFFVVGSFKIDRIAIVLSSDREMFHTTLVVKKRGCREGNKEVDNEFRGCGRQLREDGLKKKE